MKFPKISLKIGSKLGVMSGLGVVFAVLNLDEVSVNWIIGTWDTPLIIVIAISVLVGAALGYLAARRRQSAPR